VLLTAAACVLLAACGTTASNRQGSASRPSDALAPESAVAADTGSAQQASGSVSGLGTGGSSPDRSESGSSLLPADRLAGSPAADGAASSTQRSARAVAPYKVGLIWSSNAEAALRAIGGKGDLGDWQGDGEAVIRYINAHGGMGGRPLVSRWYDADATLSASENGSKACAQWTEDDHIDGAVSGAPIVDNNAVRTCLAKHSIPAISNEWHVQTRARDFRTSPLWVEPLTLSMESFAKTYADGLAAQGFFKGGRVGILYDEGPDWAAVEQTVLEPELRRLGVTVAAKASYALRDFTQVHSAEPALNEAVLRFRQAGVNRVISFEPWEGWGFFMLAAKNQNYYPTYGLSTQTAWEVAYATGLVPDDEMKDAYYVGWSPVLDVPNPDPAWPRLQLCRNIYRAEGMQFNGPMAEMVALSMCDGLLDLRDVGSVVHGGLTAANFASAREDVSWQSAFMPSMAMSTTRPYGVVSARPARWRMSDTQFVYSGPSRSASS
jgi:hypothetical protein